MARDTLFDSLKFVLISCVVLGHVLNLMHDSQINLAIWNWLYSFEMPLFVFVSGYFTRKKSLQKMGGVKLIETLLVWNSIYCILHPSLSFSWINLIKPSFAYWYLLCLVIWRFIIEIVPFDKINQYMVVTACLIIGLLFGFINIDGGLFSVSRVFSFFPFFIMGYYAKNTNIIYRLRNVSHKLSISLLLAILLLFYFMNESYAEYFNCSRPYALDGGLYKGLLYRTLFYFLSFIQGCAIINIIPDLKIFAKLGEKTMQIYIFHGFGIIILTYLIGNLPTSIYCAFIYTFLIVFFINFIAKYIDLNFLLNPISFLCKKKDMD